MPILLANSPKVNRRSWQARGLVFAYGPTPQAGKVWRNGVGDIRQGDIRGLGGGLPYFVRPGPGGLAWLNCRYLTEDASNISSYLRISDTGLPSGDSDRTIMFRFRVTTLARYNALFAMGSYAAGNAVMIYTTQTTGAWLVSAHTYDVTVSGNAVVAGVTYHAALTIADAGTNSAQWTFYVNGIQAGQNTITTNTLIPSADAYCYFGRGMTSEGLTNDGNMDGTITDCRMYNYCMNGSQIRKISSERTRYELWESPDNWSPPFGYPAVVGSGNTRPATLLTLGV